MKHTLRFLIVFLCLMFSISAFADQRGADLFKPVSNYSSPSQWTRSNSGNGFSYSRTAQGSYYEGGQSVSYGRSVTGSYSDNNSIYGGATRDVQYATDDFIDGNDGRPGQQRVRGFASANPGEPQNPPVGDAIPFVVVLAVAFAAYKSRKKIAALIMR